jgi:hypothetical protein
VAEPPADLIRRAAALMRKRASEATPGPWERPLDTRSKSIVGAALPEDEAPREWQNGIIPETFGQYPGYTNRYAGQRERVSVVQCNTWSDGTHDRKRNGRDLEYIAAMNPLVGLAVADWLDREASLLDAQVFPQSDPAMEKYPLAVARAYLGETDKEG